MTETEKLSLQFGLYFKGLFAWSTSEFKIFLWCSHYVNGIIDININSIHLLAIAFAIGPCERNLTMLASFKLGESDTANKWVMLFCYGATTHIQERKTSKKKRIYSISASMISFVNKHVNQWFNHLVNYNWIIFDLDYLKIVIRAALFLNNVFYPMRIYNTH